MNTISSTVHGKAFKYACILALSKNLQTIRPFEIIKNSSYFIAKERYENEITAIEQHEMLTSANVGISEIIKMEPQIIENDETLLTISLQPDTIATKQGDIRDILIIRKNIEWEIGISVKHNHSALKHSRLSRNLDFGKIWLEKECSNKYFKEIEPIFNFLDSCRKNGLKWNELKNKDTDVYLPLLLAFKKELLQINSIKNITSHLVKYLIGSNGNDYYKLMSNKNKTTTIIPFNIYGTLNSSSKNIKPKIKVPRIELPTKILDFSFKENSNTTLILTLNNSWVVSFRIHNASTYIEPSLKFDIQLKGIPSDIFYINKAW